MWKKTKANPKLDLLGIAKNPKVSHIQTQIKVIDTLYAVNLNGFIPNLFFILYIDPEPA